LIQQYKLQRSAFASPIRFSLRFRVSSLLYIPLYVLLLWYILYPGLSRIVPFYDTVDELLQISLLMLILARIALRPRRLRIHVVAWSVLLIITCITFVSTTLNDVGIVIFFQFLYSVTRSLIILLYLTLLDIDVERVFNWFVTAAWLMIIYNLPAVLMNLAKYNVLILQAAYNDSIIGFFPFTNNDSLVFLYTIVVCAEGFRLFFKGDWTRVLFFAGAYGLLLTTMNFRYAMLVTVALTAVISLRGRRKFRNAFILGTITLLGALVLLPVIMPRIKGIQFSPAYIAAEKLYLGEVSEYSLVLGTGPGNYASPIAYERRAPLTARYGLLEVYNYWQNVYQGPTGTFTGFSSSLVTLFGDTGLIAGLSFMALLALGLWQCFSYSTKAPVCLLAFVMGTIAVVIGMFLNTWFWGLEILLFFMGIKHCWDIQTGRLSRPGLPTKSGYEIQNVH
jgi:hypothetical protein